MAVSDATDGTGPSPHRKRTGFRGLAPFRFDFIRLHEKPGSDTIEGMTPCQDPVESCAMHATHTITVRQFKDDPLPTTWAVCEGHLAKWQHDIAEIGWLLEIAGQ